MFRGNTQLVSDATQSISSFCEYLGPSWLLSTRLFQLEIYSPSSSSSCKSVSLSRREPVTLPPVWLVAWQIIKQVGRYCKTQLHAHQPGIRALLLELQGTSDTSSWPLWRKEFILFQASWDGSWGNIPNLLFLNICIWSYRFFYNHF